MKKSLIITLAMVFVLSIAGTAFAANPFVDVPAKHWAYDSLQKVQKAGLIDGFGDGTFKGDATLTRYQVASIVGKCMANWEKADADVKASTKADVDRLAAEFRAELDNLGVKVDQLDAAVKAMPKWSGEFRFRTEKALDPSVTTSTVRSRISVNGAINDNWSYAGRFQNTQNMLTSGAEDTVTLNVANVTGNLGSVDLTLGRFLPFSAYGLQYDDYLDGVQFGLGKDAFKAQIYFGKPNLNAPAVNSNMTGVNMSYAFNNDTNAKLSYLNVNPRTANVDTARYWEIGFDTKVAPELVFTGTYGKSNANTENKAYVVQLDYKATDRQVPGTWSLGLQYSHIKANATYDTTWIDGNVDQTNQKGFQFYGAYVPAKNIELRGMIADYKQITNTNIKNRAYRMDMMFWF